jgi:hypothetical protein
MAACVTVDGASWLQPPPHGAARLESDFVPGLFRLLREIMRHCHT